MPLICLSCAWVAGIFLGAEELDLPLAFILIGLIPLPLLLFASKHKKLIILASFSLIILFAAIAYSYSSLHTVNESSLRSYNDNITEIKGMVARDPEVRDKSTHLYLSATEIKLEKGWREVSRNSSTICAQIPYL